MARQSYIPNTAVDERIRRLEEELYIARHDIVELMPCQMKDLLTSYYSCETSMEFWRWKHDIAERIASMTEPDPEAASFGYFGDRAYCPLCKSGSRGPYDRGFALPNGLTSHLLGQGNTHHCPVTHAAFENAHHSLRDKLAASAEAERRKEEERRRTERVFLIDPSSPPKLFDEHLFGEKRRSPEELAAAEERLRGLDFRVEVDQNVVAYKFPYEHYLVLADPRKAGRIEFRVFNNEGTKRRTARRSETFYLLDTWSNNLAEKFKDRLSQACMLLAPQQRPKAVGPRKRQSSPPPAAE
jgi:hypothetical protein